LGIDRLMREGWFARVQETGKGWQAWLVLYDIEREVELDRYAVGSPLRNKHQAQRRALTALNTANAALAFGPGAGDEEEADG